MRVAEDRAKIERFKAKEELKALKAASKEAKRAQKKKKKFLKKQRPSEGLDGYVHVTRHKRGRPRRRR